MDDVEYDGDDDGCDDDMYILENLPLILWGRLPPRKPQVYLDT